MRTKTFLVHQTFNKGYRAVDLATGKVEPLVAGEESFEHAREKLALLYPDWFCDVLNDPEGMYFVLQPICEAMRRKTMTNLSVRESIFLAIRGVGVQPHIAHSATHAILNSIFLAADVEFRGIVDTDRGTFSDGSSHGFLG